VWGTGTLLGQSGGTVYTNTIDVRPGATLALASTSSVFINQLITSGSMNFDNSLGIGHDQSAGTSGALTVSGGDALGVGHDLFVGYSAHASVDVIGGGQLNVQRSAYLADGSGADGTVNVSGNGSSFYVAQDLFVGEIGATALLDIDNAANVTVMNTLEIAAGSTVNLAGGSLNAVAISLASRGHLNLNGGTLRFIEFSGSPLNVGSTVEVQENSAITGTYRQTSGGTTEFDVSDPGVQPVDFLAVDTAVQLAGEIAFVHDPSTEPDLGQRMGLIGTSARGRTGMFDQVSNMFLSNDLALAVGYESDAVWVEVAIPGDITLDQFIDEADLAYLADGWKLGSGYTWASGDVTGDGVIDEADLAYLADGWKIPPVAVTVPEPTTATLVLLGILLRRRR
jgi:T5SS/PEP-CTERM-associated repeat protein